MVIMAAILSLIVGNTIVFALVYESYPFLADASLVCIISALDIVGITAILRGFLL